MKEAIHPKYFPEAKVVCHGCNREYTVGSTKEHVSVELCSNCHPFYTGKQKLVDTAGRVDRFRARAAKAKGTAEAKTPTAKPATAPEPPAPTDTPEARLAEMKKNLETDDQQ